jgi:hypothetical protein
VLAKGGGWVNFRAWHPEPQCEEDDAASWRNVETSECRVTEIAGNELSRSERDVRDNVSGKSVSR